jgi:hypothetical protein
LSTQACTTEIVKQKWARNVDNAFRTFYEDFDGEKYALEGEEKIDRVTEYATCRFEEVVLDE